MLEAHINDFVEIELGDGDSMCGEVVAGDGQYSFRPDRRLKVRNGEQAVWTTNSKVKRIVLKASSAFDISVACDKLKSLN